MVLPTAVLFLDGKCPDGSDQAAFIAPYNETFTKDIRTEIRPFFSTEKKLWLFPAAYISKFLRIAKDYYEVVDTTAQSNLAAKIGSKAHKTLQVSEEASTLVIDAAFNALMGKLTNSAEDKKTKKRYETAYDQIVKMG